MSYDLSVKRKGFQKMHTRCNYNILSGGVRLLRLRATEQGTAAFLLIDGDRGVRLRPLEPPERVLEKRLEAGHAVVVTPH